MPGRHRRLITDYSQACGTLGLLYVSQRRLDGGKAKFEEIVKRQPKPVGAMTMVAMIPGMQGKDAEARKAYERSLDIDPRAPAGERRSLEQALKLRATFPEAAEARTTLASIPK